MDIKLAKLTKILLDFMFYAGIVATLAVPAAFKVLGNYYPNIGNFYVVMCILFMLSGVFAVLILHRLRRIFKTVLQRNCFVYENVSSLRDMGIFSLLIALVTTSRLLFVITPATLVIILVFFIAGLFSFVLEQVFSEAIKYKEENDLTI